jgi:crossover junction endodeoxyribonuclease RusA
VILTLSGQAISTQHCYRSTTANGYNRSYMTQKCVDLKEAWQWEAKSQWGADPVTCELRVTLDIYHGDKRKRDVDNFNKLVFDALTGIVYEDDSQIIELTIRKHYDKAAPRVEVTISPCVLAS